MFKKIRRFNRKYRQFVNYGVTALIVSVLVGFLMFHQDRVNQENMSQVVSNYEAMKTTLINRQDSLMLEVDRLKIGIDDATERRFKIQNTANIITGVQKSYSESEALKLATDIFEEAERLDLPLSYVLSIITVESRFNHKVTSNVGAQGIMQVMPSTFMAVARIHGYDYVDKDIYDLKKNMRIGCVFLHRLISKYESLDVASAAYNGGPKVAIRYKQRLAGDTTVSIPDETEKYIVTVRKNYKEYRKILGE